MPSLEKITIGEAPKYWNEIMKVLKASASLMSEDGAQEALSQYVVLQILRDALKELDDV